MKSRTNKKVNIKKKREKYHKFEMPKWMECGWRRVGCGKDNCPLCGRIKRDRQKHLDKGENPDSLKSAFEDVSQNFMEALTLIKQDAESKGINITNIDDIKKPPKPEKFPLYNEVRGWRDFVNAIFEDEEILGEIWLATEASQDIIWYSNLLSGKVYRQLCNRWEMENRDAYGEFDYEYTQNVIKESLKIMKRAFLELISYKTGQAVNLMRAQSYLAEFENKILKI